MPTWNPHWAVFKDLCFKKNEFQNVPSNLFKSRLKFQQHFFVKIYNTTTIAWG